MKLVLLSLFSFALCAIQKPFPEDAFQAYSLKDQSISRENFARIDEFISRIEEAGDKDLVTEQDKKMLLEMGFDCLVIALYVPECFGDQGEADSHLAWGEISTFTRRLETSCDENNACKTIEHGMPFAKLLGFLYSYETIDALSREQFFDFYYLLDFLRGGKQISMIRKLKSLDQMYGMAMTNSDLVFSRKNEIFRMVLFSILAPTTLSLDLHMLCLRFTQDINSIVEDVVECLAEGFRFNGISRLEKVVFKRSASNQRMQAHLFQILAQNAENITSLEIYTDEFNCPSTILFPNV